MKKEIIEGVEGSLTLRPVYDELNKKYFGNALPSIKVSWDGRLKRAVGRAAVKYRMNKMIPGSKPEIDMKSLKITMSKAFDLDYKDTQAVLLHEMVHIKLYVNGDLGKHHGTPSFVGEINRLKKESGLNVPYKESSFKHSPTAAAAEGYIAILTTSGGTGISVYSTPFMNKNWRALASWFDSFIPAKKVRKVELWLVNHPFVKTSTKKRSLKRISWSIQPNDEVEKIKKTGFQFASFGVGKNWIDTTKTKLPGGTKINFR